MRNDPFINEPKTKQSLLNSLYQSQARRSQFGPYVGALKKPFAQDKADIIAFIEGVGHDLQFMFPTPLGRAIENDTQGWPRTRWADNNADQETTFKAAFKWMMRFESRIRDICDLDEALLAEGIDFALTGDLVGRSNTWRSPHGWRSLKRTERLLRELLASGPVSVFVGDKNQMEALRQLRKQGHIIIVSAPYADEIEDPYGTVIQRSEPLVDLTYLQTER
jgi:hypothetical protein